jgi:predicted dehydrogenase
MEKEKIKVGVFGVGHLGKFHLNNWRKMEGVELVGFYDPDDAQAAIAEKEYGITRYTDADLLMDDSEAIDIVAPTNIHFAIASEEPVVVVKMCAVCVRTFVGSVDLRC